MFQNKSRGLGQVMIAYASTLHILWAAIVLVDLSAYNSTALSGVFSVFGSATPLVLFTVGGLALLAFRIPNRASVRLIMMAPQYSILIISAYTAGSCIWRGAYADGVIRPWAFIMADQLPALLGAIFYSVAMILNGLPPLIIVLPKSRQD